MIMKSIWYLRSSRSMFCALAKVGPQDIRPGKPLFKTEGIGEGKGVMPESYPSGEAGKRGLLILVNLEYGQ